MNKSDFFRHVTIDDYSATPKYQQLANAIIQAVKTGKIAEQEVLPSINELSFEFAISRDTAEKGYKYLKKIGLLGSVPGKGYFIKSALIDQQLKIFLLFNKLSAHKKIIYDAFASALGELASIDFYVYNNDLALFRKLIQNRKENYTHFVIIPHFLKGEESAYEIVNTLDKSKLILLDKLLPNVNGEYGAVYENFESDIYEALHQALPQLGKYHTLKIIFPEHTYFPQEIITGFVRFCQEFAFHYHIVHSLAHETMERGEVYISLMEDDLVTLIERVISKHWMVGKEVGVISYNETPLKRIILNGITTISTDFKMMGEKAAQLVLENSTAHVAAPFYLTLRSSL
ncbi:MAG: transcriptional regulator [Azospira oryzae]|jgi:DNA-binding transcriptional regulator YhcF (GntR family)|nr:MAG: transcriptional regulator [Azospira oryzae]